MKLTTMTQVTVDGVMQGNGGASDEDRRNGFERGGWAMGVFDNETMTLIEQAYQRADAFLFGRRTYELFALVTRAQRSGLGAAAEDPGNHQITDALRHKAQVPRIEHAHRTALGEHDRPLRRRRGGHRRAKSEAWGRAAGARQRRPDPVAAR